MTKHKKPHLVMVLARGGAVRNFLYSDTLKILVKNAKVTLLSAYKGNDNLASIEAMVDQVYELKNFPENPRVADFRYMLSMAHNRWLWSQASKYHWVADYKYAHTKRRKIKLLLLKGLALPLANRGLIERLSDVENELFWRFRPTTDFEKLYEQLHPDLVFNCSHIHGPLADLPMRIANKLDIPTAGFIYSWDNLSSRSRIFVPYNYYFVWTEGIRNEFLKLYPYISPPKVFVTGTPQFDFHFDPSFHWTREQLSEKLGLDPDRPYILYTTGYSKDFPEEYRILQEIIHMVDKIDYYPKPQLVVRTFFYSNDPSLKELSEKKFPDVFFPPFMWDSKNIFPKIEDQYIYTNLLRHCSVGINAASTVSLELMMLDKPVINLGFEPPNSHLEHWTRFSRHIKYDHYQPVIDSGGVLVAYSMEDVKNLIDISLAEPSAQHAARKRFIKSMFGNTLDGQSGKRIAEKLLELSTNSHH